MSNPQHSMQKTVVTLVFIMMAACLLHGQAPSDWEHGLRDVQHTLIHKGDVFVFERRNTHTRSQYSSVERIPEDVERDLFRIGYPFTRNSLFFFRLRHPLTIRPYTQYVLRLNARVDQLEGNGHYVEITVFDETRETEVEFHRLTMNNTTAGWKAQDLMFTTGGKARFARLHIHSHPESSGEAWLSDLWLEHTSEPYAAKPEPVVVGDLSGVTTTTEDQVLLSTALPSDRQYYAISVDIGWSKFKGYQTLAFEWHQGATSSSPLTTERCEISNIEGIQPQWDGVAVQWWKKDNGPVDFISRKKDKLFNTVGNGGQGNVIYRVNKPEGAGFLRVVVRQGKRSGGEMVIERLLVVAES